VLLKIGVRDKRLDFDVISWYNVDMTSKEIAIKTIQGLPDSATWNDIEERIRFLAAIEEGLEDIKAGRVIPHQDVKESLQQWLSA
jgi:predicted transcriptional regulator